MKILKQGKTKEPIPLGRNKCDKCECEYEYTKEDVFICVGKEYVRCPNCGSYELI